MLAARRGTQHPLMGGEVHVFLLSRRAGRPGRGRRLTVAGCGAGVGIAAMAAEVNEGGVERRRRGSRCSDGDGGGEDGGGEDPGAVRMGAISDLDQEQIVMMAPDPRGVGYRHCGGGRDARNDLRLPRPLRHPRPYIAAAPRAPSSELVSYFT